jgi:VWFA-related protein
VPTWWLGIRGSKSAQVGPMRLAAAALLLASAAWAQFKSTVPLVVVPTTIKDARGHFVDGLTAEDLALFDNNVRHRVQLDWTIYPIDLVVAVQTSSNSLPVIDKLGGSGILFTELLAADAGQTALISFSDEVTVRQAFSGDSDAVTHALRMLRSDGDTARIMDALDLALGMVASRPTSRRRIILMIAEKRDRGSHAKLPEVMEKIERLNVTVYWLTYSPFLQPFTVKPKTMEDLKPEAERIKSQKCSLCPAPDNRAAPLDVGPGGLIYALGELVRLHKPDLSELFPKVTGGHSLPFLKKNDLEKAIQLVGQEVHRQYVLSFQPNAGDSGRFHPIRVIVKDRPELRVTSREGYWAVE